MTNGQLGPRGQEQQRRFAAEVRAREALERDAFAYRELMDPHELPGDQRTEALRRTARGAAEDWLEAKSNAAEREQMFRMAEGDAD